MCGKLECRVSCDVLIQYFQIWFSFDAVFNNIADHFDALLQSYHRMLDVCPRR